MRQAFCIRPSTALQYEFPFTSNSPKDMIQCKNCLWNVTNIFTSVDLVLKTKDTLHRAGYAPAHQHEGQALGSFYHGRHETLLLQ